jgi:5-methylcytosine-specific restriction endonuclease McrA
MTDRHFKYMAKSLKYYRNRADKILQETGRAIYKKCLVCGKPMSCLHHYFPKSTAGNLRYHWNNLIPICQGCHFKLHNGDPRIQNTINEVKGKDWLDELNAEKRKFVKCNTIGYFKDMCEKLKLLTPYKTK